jgi:hypothetical protein
MKRTVVILDSSTNEERKFIVEINIERAANFAVTKFMEGLSVDTSIMVKEVPNVTVHSIVHSAHSLPNKMLAKLKSGDVIPYYSTVRGATLRETLDRLHVTVEFCAAPEESPRAFGALQVKEIRKPLAWVE